MKAPLLLALFLLGACGGGGSHAETPLVLPERPNPTLAQLKGLWASTDGTPPATFRIDEDSQITRTEGPAEKQCQVRGEARVYADPSSDDSWLEIKLSQDTCREPLVYRTDRVARRTPDTLVLTELHENDRTSAPQTFRRR